MPVFTTVRLGTPCLIAIFLAGPGCVRSSPKTSSGGPQHFDSGVELIHQGLYPGAMAEFRRARALGINTAELHYHLACMESLAAPQPDLVEPSIRGELRAALALDPNHVPSLLFSAELARLPQNGLSGTQEALELYEKVLDLRPEWGDLRLNIVEWLLQRPMMISPKLGDHTIRIPGDSNWSLQLAQQQLEKVLQTVNPFPRDRQTAGQARLELGIVLLRMGEYRKAAEQLELADRLLSQLPEAIRYRAQCSWPAGLALHKQRP